MTSSVLVHDKSIQRAQHVAGSILVIHEAATILHLKSAAVEVGVIAPGLRCILRWLFGTTARVMLAIIAAAVTGFIVVDVLLSIYLGRLVGVPGLGGTAAFFMYGCDYLAWAAAVTKGDFSISLMFKTYTFLNSPSSIRFFSNASRHELALQPAVLHFTKKNFGLSSELWSEGEARPAHVLRKMLAPHQLADRNTQLCRCLLQLRHQYFTQPQVWSSTNSVVQDC